MKAKGAIVGVVGWLAAALPCAAWAAEAKDCAQLVDTALRLACYDEAHKPPTAGSGKAGQWRVTRQTSKIDDSPEVFVAVQARDLVPGKDGAPSAGILMISCREGATDVFFNFGETAMAKGKATSLVTTRIDKRRARKMRMTGSHDRKALGLWTSGRAVPFVKTMLDGSSLFVRAMPPEEEAVDMEFEIGGLDEAIKPLREACRW